MTFKALTGNRGRKPNAGTAWVYKVLTGQELAEVDGKRIDPFERAEDGTVSFRVRDVMTFDAEGNYITSNSNKVVTWGQPGSGTEGAQPIPRALYLENEDGTPRTIKAEQVRLRSQLSLAETKAEEVGFVGSVGLRAGFETDADAMLLALTVSAPKNRKE